MIMGQVLQAGAGQAPARQAAIGAGLPEGDARGHDQQGLRVVDPRDRDRRPDDPRRRARARRHGRHGVDVERAVPARAKARFGYRLGSGELIDSMIFDGLTSTFDGLHMVRQNSLVSRGARDLARGAGRLGGSVAAARRRGAGGGPLRRRDRPRRRAGGRRERAPRHDARDAREAEARLRPATGRRPPATRPASTTVPRAWSSAPRSSRRRRGLEPLATILAQGYVADDFAYLARTPARRGQRRRSRRRASAIEDVKRVEINEAFSSVALNSTRMLGADEERERERRRGRARPPDRSQRRPDRRHDGARAAPNGGGSASPRSAPAAARATRC